jgi:hypothetical protein
LEIGAHHRPASLDYFPCSVDWSTRFATKALG